MTIDARPTADARATDDDGRRLRILKFALPVWGPAELRTARLGRFLDVGWQDGHPVIWAEALPGDIGTVQTLDAPTISPYVVHVYRVAS